MMKFRKHIATRDVEFGKDFMPWHHRRIAQVQQELRDSYDAQLDKAMQALHCELDNVHAELNKAKLDNAKLEEDNANHVKEIAEPKKQLAAAKMML